MQKLQRLLKSWGSELEVCKCKQNEEKEIITVVTTESWEYHNTIIIVNVDIGQWRPGVGLPNGFLW